MKTPISTSGGVFAVNDTISFLRLMKPVDPMTLSRGLCTAAKNYVVESGPQTTIGTKVGNLTTRIQEYGSFNGSCVDIQSFGKKKA